MSARTMPDRAWIERCLPHGPTMCLLDAVTDWDATRISCIAAAPDAAHPLARAGVVPAITAIEYAAQATALHGAAIHGAVSARPGMLAKIMGVTLHAARLPAAGERLDVHAEKLADGESGCLYRFAVSSGNCPIADGRLMVVFASEHNP
jgi:predicted hotdog family 3-hydroxylacyl-ACP dehydratase